LKISAKNAISLISSGKKQFHHFWLPAAKLLENPLVVLPGKTFPTPMHTSM